MIDWSDWWWLLPTGPAIIWFIVALIASVLVELPRPFREAREQEAKVRADQQRRMTSNARLKREHQAILEHSEWLKDNERWRHLHP